MPNKDSNDKKLLPKNQPSSSEQRSITELQGSDQNSDATTSTNTASSSVQISLQTSGYVFFDALQPPEAEPLLAESELSDESPSVSEQQSQQQQPSLTKKALKKRRQKLCIRPASSSEFIPWPVLGTIGDPDFKVPLECMLASEKARSYMIEHDLVPPVAVSQKTCCLPVSSDYTKIFNPLKELVQDEEESEKFSEPVEKFVGMIGKPLAPRASQLSKVYEPIASSSPSYYPTPITRTSLDTNPAFIETTFKSKVSVPIESTSLAHISGTPNFVAPAPSPSPAATTLLGTTSTFITPTSRCTISLPKAFLPKTSDHASFDALKNSTSPRPIETSSLNTVFTPILSASHHTTPVTLPSALQMTTSKSTSTSQSSISSDEIIFPMSVSSASRASTPVFFSSIGQETVLEPTETLALPSMPLLDVLQLLSSASTETAPQVIRDEQEKSLVAETSSKNTDLESVSKTLAAATSTTFMTLEVSKPIETASQASGYIFYDPDIYPSSSEDKGFQSILSTPKPATLTSIKTTSQISDDTFTFIKALSKNETLEPALSTPPVAIFASKHSTSRDLDTIASTSQDKRIKNLAFSVSEASEEAYEISTPTFDMTEEFSYEMRDIPLVDVTFLSKFKEPAKIRQQISDVAIARSKRTPEVKLIPKPEIEFQPQLPPQPPPQPPPHSSPKPNLIPPNPIIVDNNFSYAKKRLGLLKAILIVS